MAEALDPEELEEWRTIFNLFDVDGDQSITHEELGIVLRSMGQNPSEKELVDMIGEMDEDGSGTVDFEEFVILMKRRTADSDGNDDIEAAFRVFDTNGDGWESRFIKRNYDWFPFSRVIDIDELMSVLVMLGNPRTEEEVKIMIAEEDSNEDGVIDREEFFSMLQRKNQISSE